MALSLMMSQYLKTKEQYKDCILFFRLGDFYEMFFEDAIECSKVLDLTLTGKDCGLPERAPMCGIPHHSSEQYIRKLIENGYKVAVCEQLTEPQKGVKIVERGVVRVITPGTIIEENMLDDKKNNYIVCIYENQNKFGIAYSDVSTGEFNTAEFKDENSLNELNDILVRIKPSEIICNSTAKKYIIGLPSYQLNNLVKPFEYYEWAFEGTKAKQILTKQFSQNCLEVFEIINNYLSIGACAALIEYLNETQKRFLSHIRTINKIHNDDFMILDINTRRNLEITETIRDRKKKGSLLWLLDNTKTNMGARLFRKWLDQPLKNSKEINSRLDSVEEIIKSVILRENLSNQLNKINDIERLAGKIAYGNIMPRECIGLVESLERAPFIKEILRETKSEKLADFYNHIYDFLDLSTLIKNAINPKAPLTMKEGDFIKSGFNKELDEYRELSINAKKWMSGIEIKERERTGIKNLKISYNKVFGYYIEINKSQIENVPLDYIRKQTVANNERYITEDLKLLEEKILNAEENAIKLEISIYNDIRIELTKTIDKMLKFSKILAELDCLLSFSIIAIKNNYIKPKINNKINHISIIDGRHPVVQAVLKDEIFIPNDTYLNTNTDKIMVITGPNMAGKSTYMRQVAILTLMAHIGSFVPAKQAEFSITDRIFTRVGASDDLAFGQSTFMVEMTEVALILANATKDSLVILDEIGRGTSTFDGLSIAWAVIEELANKYKCKTLFATHYHELCELEGFLNGVKNYRVSIKEFNKNIIFLHKIVRGGANKSFGIEVASLAGIPKTVIERAKTISIGLEETDIKKNINMHNLTNQNLQTSDSNLKSNKIMEEIMQILKDTKIEKLSPMDAFDHLNNILNVFKRDKL